MVPLKITFTGLMLGVVAALVIGSAEAHDPDHADACKHGRSAHRHDQHQAFDRGLPFLECWSAFGSSVM